MIECSSGPVLYLRFALLSAGSYVFIVLKIPSGESQIQRHGHACFIEHGFAAEHHFLRSQSANVELFLAADEDSSVYEPMVLSPLYSLRIITQKDGLAANWTKGYKYTNGSSKGIVRASTLPRLLIHVITISSSCRWTDIRE